MYNTLRQQSNIYKVISFKDNKTVIEEAGLTEVLTQIIKKLGRNPYRQFAMPHESYDLTVGTFFLNSFKSPVERIYHLVDGDGRVINIFNYISEISRLSKIVDIEPTKRIYRPAKHKFVFRYDPVPHTHGYHRRFGYNVTCGWKRRLREAVIDPEWTKPKDSIASTQNTIFWGIDCSPSQRNWKSQYKCRKQWQIHKAIGKPIEFDMSDWYASDSMELVDIGWYASDGMELMGIDWNGEK